MSWRLAKSLVTLRDQINQAAPNRSKKSDGTIGDAAHASRASDHNPNKAGVVCAFDVTHDPAGDMDCHVLAEQLQASKDPRIQYVIWDGKIMSGSHSKRAWEWREYTGTNPHRHHLHISVSQDPSKYDDPRLWDIGSKPKDEPSTAVVAGKRVPVLRHGDVLYAPLRAVAEALGATVAFDQATGSVTVTK